MRRAADAAREASTYPKAQSRAANGRVPDLAEPHGWLNWTEALCIEEMALIGQQHPQRAAHDHQSLVRTKGLVSRKDVDIGAEAADIIALYGAGVVQVVRA